MIFSAPKDIESVQLLARSRPIVKPACKQVARGVEIGIRARARVTQLTDRRRGVKWQFRNLRSSGGFFVCLDIFAGDEKLRFSF